MASMSKCTIFVGILLTQIIMLLIYLINSDRNSRIYFKTIQSTGYTGFNNSYRANDISGNRALQLLVDASRDRTTKTNDKTSSAVETTRKHEDVNTSTVGSDKDRKLVSYDKRKPADRAETFQPIGSSLAWVYSAHYDHMAAQNGQPMVRVFGVVHKRCLAKAYCHFNDENAASFTSFAKFTDLLDSHFKSYIPAYLECPLPNNERPTHVSVSFQTTDKPTNRLQILYPGPRIRNFTVCYSVLHSVYNNPTQLIESIEMNQIFGAEHFMVYNYSISPAVDQILRRYQEDGLVTVLQWQIPTLGSWYFAQMTALNDCFFRNRNISKFVVVVDTDEQIMPRSNHTWMEVIHHASSHDINISNSSHTNNKRACCFIFKSSFFYIDNVVSSNRQSKYVNFSLTDNEKDIISKYNITVLSKLIRARKIFRYNVRSKYIACPDHVQIAGIHYVTKLLFNGECMRVAVNLAFVNHYRNPKRMIFSDFVLDTSALKFKTKIMKRMENQYKRFPNLFLRRLT